MEEPALRGNGDGARRIGGRGHRGSATSRSAFRVERGSRGGHDSWGPSLVGRDNDMGAPQVPFEAARTQGNVDAGALKDAFGQRLLGLGDRR